MIKDLLITPLSIIDAQGGEVMHAMKNSSIGFSGYGEAYFSQIDMGAVKAWKRHKRMILNLIVPIGRIKFVLFDDREKNNKVFQEVTLSRDNYCRLTVPPMIWVGFQGMDSNQNILLNIADIEHSPEEVDRREIDDFKFKWS